jgi:hypothetical protein
LFHSYAIAHDTGLSSDHAVLPLDAVELVVADLGFEVAAAEARLAGIRAGERPRRSVELSRIYTNSWLVVFLLARYSHAACRSLGCSLVPALRTHWPTRPPVVTILGHVGG